jgi:hypothetical protein
MEITSFQFMDKLDNLALSLAHPTVRPGSQRHENQEGRVIHVLLSSCGVVAVVLSLKRLPKIISV